MKNVAGFHSSDQKPLFPFGEPFSDLRNGFGTMEDHKDGEAMRGSADSEELYGRSGGCATIRERTILFTFC